MVVEQLVALLTARLLCRPPAAEAAVALKQPLSAVAMLYIAQAAAAAGLYWLQQLLPAVTEAFLSSHNPLLPVVRSGRTLAALQSWAQPYSRGEALPAAAAPIRRATAATAALRLACPVLVVAAVGQEPLAGETAQRPLPRA